MDMAGQQSIAGDVVLELIDVTMRFSFGQTNLVAVNDTSIQVRKKEIVGIVGESGCGKSMTIRTVLGIVPHPGEVIAGEIYFEGQDILKLRDAQIRKIRGDRISLVYQDPLSSLNPSFTIFWHFNEIIRSHRKRLSKKQKVEMIIGALRKVRIPEPELKVWQYPHQFSGGMRQRVAIAMALLLEPAVVIADEPTTALDVTTQKEVFNLIEKLKEEEETSFIIISHDLRLIGERCDRIYVMYSGQVVESGPSEQILENPLSPYTKGLIDSIPSLKSDVTKLVTIDGEVQSLVNLPKGCFFASRCALAEDRCRAEAQELREIPGARTVRCWKVK